jgi:hypothetical protein
MAEKRVSVRLAAVGGKQVRAELEGVGDAGVKGFGRMSKEAEIANARLAAFSTRVKIAAAVAVAAAAAAGIAMIKSGLETIDAQANLAQSLGTTTRSIQVLAFAGDLAGVSMDEITAATKKLTLKLSDAAGGTGTAVAALQRLHLTATDLQALPLDERIVAIQDALTKFVPPAERAAVASALFGDKAALAFSRIDSATLRQASQDVTDFGVAVSDQDADQIRTAGDAIDRLGLVWLGLTNQLTVAVAPALETVANALADATRAGGIFQTSISYLGGHIGEIASIAGAFATFFAGRFVVALGAAALGISGFSVSLTVLRGALIRTGVGALIVAAGELVYQFSRLVAGAGGFGKAMALLGDLVAEVWDRLKLGAASFGASAFASFASLEAASATALQGALEAVTSFANAAVNTFEGAFAAIKAIWGLLPAAIGDFAFQAANSLIEGVEGMLNGVVARINGFIAGINSGLEALGSERRIGLIADLDIGHLENRFEGAATRAAGAAQDAFAAAFADAPFAVPDLGLTGAASAAAESAETWRKTAGLLAEGARQPLASLEALRSAITATGDEAGTALEDSVGAVTALDDTTTAAGRAGAALKDVGAAAGSAADEAKKALERIAEVAKGLAEDITGPLKAALKSGEISWQSFAGAVSGIATNLASRLIDTAFKPIEDALFRAFSGGGAGGAGSGGGLFGWIGSAIGGLFGQGGLYARGGAFGPAGEITAFARGGVVTRPTLFPFSRGIGLMGEAGPEAILPLRRGPGGRLGVDAGTAASSAPAPAPQFTTRIINVLDPGVVGDYLATPAGERAIVNVIRRNRGAFNG